MTAPLPETAFTDAGANVFHGSGYTRGPWDPGHQHAGPPTALVCRAIEAAAAASGLTHLGRLTANLLRPVPLGDVQVEVQADYVGRSAAHYSARLLAQGKELARFTALMQRQTPQPLPPDLPGHPLPTAPAAPLACTPVVMPFAGATRSYADLVELRLARGAFFAGPCFVWFRLRHPLLPDETPSPYQRVAVAADSGNGISAALPFATHSFVNSDLTINLLRQPRGEWIGLDARTALAGNGCGLAQSELYDEAGLIGHATQSLAVRARSSP